MIRVRIENIPNNDDRGAEVIGELKIEQHGWLNCTYIIDNDVEKSGRISHYFKGHSAWELLLKILEQEYMED